jgi:hypothetical protein
MTKPRLTEAQLRRMRADSLVDALNVLSTPSRQCKVCDALAQLTPEEGESLRKALKSKVGARRLANTLQLHGVDVGSPSVIRHRQEEHTA